MYFHRRGEVCRKADRNTCDGRVQHLELALWLVRPTILWPPNCRIERSTASLRLHRLRKAILWARPTSPILTLYHRWVNGEAVRFARMLRAVQLSPISARTASAVHACRYWVYPRPMASGATWPLGRSPTVLCRRTRRLRPSGWLRLLAAGRCGRRVYQRQVLPRYMRLKELKELGRLNPLPLLRQRPAHRLFPFFQRRDFHRDPAGAGLADDNPVQIDIAVVGEVFDFI